MPARGPRLTIGQQLAEGSDVESKPGSSGWHLALGRAGGPNYLGEPRVVERLRSKARSISVAFAIAWPPHRAFRVEAGRLMRRADSILRFSCGPLARNARTPEEVKPGEIFNVPRRVPHGFAKIGDENLILLVIATVGWKPLEDTESYE